MSFLVGFDEGQKQIKSVGLQNPYLPSFVSAKRVYIVASYINVRKARLTRSKSPLFFFFLSRLTGLGTSKLWALSRPVRDGPRIPCCRPCTEYSRLDSGVQWLPLFSFLSLSPRKWASDASQQWSDPTLLRMYWIFESQRILFVFGPPRPGLLVIP